SFSASRINGSIRFANHRLSGQVEMTHNQIENVEVGETARATLTQHLTRADAVHILNHSNSFYFDQLFIDLTSPKLAEVIKLTPLGSIENKELREKYPPLKINITNASYRPFAN